MKNVITTFVIVLLCQVVTVAQNCFSDAGEDYRTCNFQDTLIGIPAGGTWSLICSDTSGTVSLEEFNDSSVFVTYLECGTYAFEYFVSLDTCAIRDTVQVDFENPSFTTFEVDVDIDLAYQNYTCPPDDSVSCQAEYMVMGNAPEPLWSFLSMGECAATIYTGSTVGNVDNCVADSIIISVDFFSGGVDTFAVQTFPQVAFATVENEMVVENDFLELAQNQIFSAVNQLSPNCPSPILCHPIPPECVDTLFDTLLVEIPIHLEGNWTAFIDGNFIDLNYNNTFTIDTTDYFLSVSPNVNSYNATFRLLEFTADGDTVFITSPVALNLQWKENWILDTDTLFYTRYEVSDSCCGGGTKILPDPPVFDIPPIPNYDCLPFSITFFPELLASAPEVFCGDSTYFVQVNLSGGLPPYFSDGLLGMINNLPPGQAGNIFTSLPIPLDEVHFSINFVDSGNCETTVMGDDCPCLWNGETAIFDVVPTKDCGGDSLGKLWVNYVSGGFPPFQYSLDSLTFQSASIFGELAAGEYTLYIQDSFTCVTTIEFVIDSTEWIFKNDVETVIEICGSEEVLLELDIFTGSEDYYFVEWNDGDTSLFRKVDKAGNYEATVFELLTCTQYRVRFEVKDISFFSENDIRLPNAFTPNGDGVNDNFSHLLSNENVRYENYNLKIYNRWGNLVFQTDQPDEAWQPAAKNTMDVYVWFLEMVVETCDGRMIPFQGNGDLTLIR